MVSPHRSRPSQLNRAGRWRNILRTDSKTTWSMKVERESANDDCESRHYEPRFGRVSKTLYYSGVSRSNFAIVLIPACGRFPRPWCESDSYQGMPSGLAPKVRTLARLSGVEFLERT